MLPLQPEITVPPEQKVYTVSEVSTIIKEVIEDCRLQDIWVRGEVTNFRCHHSGHCWFSLTEQKDGRSCTLNCVMWKSVAAGLSFTPDNGLDILAFGYVDHYSPQGKTQLTVRDMRRAGEGEKHLLVERWKKELAADGLFALERKRPLPSYPTRIGVVTSPTGAVIADIRNVIGRRFPVEILLSPTPVQGDLAHTAIADAIRRVDGRVDVLIIARGGGSFEDLFPFNHPEVVRAVARCCTPVVSAIGHEVDITLCDLAADIRASTPSVAAELVVRDRAELRNNLRGFKHELQAGLEEHIERMRRALEDVRLHLHPRRLQRRIGERRQELGDFTERLIGAIKSRYERERLGMGRFSAIVGAHDPAVPLRKGYCIAVKEGKMVRSIKQLTKGDRLLLQLQDGSGLAQVEEVIHEKDI
jgi:exodeoxyribonuclease VII large subunit